MHAMLSRTYARRVRRPSNRFSCQRHNQQTQYARWPFACQLFCSSVRSSVRPSVQSPRAYVSCRSRRIRDTRDSVIFTRFTDFTTLRRKARFLDFTPLSGPIFTRIVTRIPLFLTQTHHPCYAPRVRVLVACEFSGIVRDAFLRHGSDAYSCDLLPAFDGNRWLSSHPRHLRCDVRDVLNDGWDLMIAHPPCTYLALSGMRHATAEKSEEALEFARTLLYAPIPRICLENPQSIIQTRITHYNQIIQPWMFGDPYQKTTWLWLKNLPNLVPSTLERPKELKTHRAFKLPRNLARSVTFPGIAEAMASQWRWPR